MSCGDEHYKAARAAAPSHWVVGNAGPAADCLAYGSHDAQCKRAVPALHLITRATYEAYLGRFRSAASAEASSPASIGCKGGSSGTSAASGSVAFRADPARTQAAAAATKARAAWEAQLRVAVRHCYARWTAAGADRPPSRPLASACTGKTVALVLSPATWRLGFMDLFSHIILGSYKKVLKHNIYKIQIK